MEYVASCRSSVGRSVEELCVVEREVGLPVLLTLTLRHATASAATAVCYRFCDRALAANPAEHYDGLQGRRTDGRRMKRGREERGEGGRV